MFWLSNRLLKQRTVLTRPPWRANARLSSGKAAGERTPLEGCFSSRQVVAW